MISDTTIYDKTHREPVGKVAAFVTSKGVRFSPPTKTQMRFWEACPRLVSEETIRLRYAENFVNLKGKTFGRFTVMGIAKDVPPNSEGMCRWVVKCQCGLFETRLRKAIFNEKNKDDRCHRCRNTEYIKRQADRASLLRLSAAIQ